MSAAAAKPDWRRGMEPERSGSRAAEDRILDAAEKAFVELGVSSAGMSEIAEAAGCSRGTLYRYFKNRHELHLAYVNREALAIVARVRAAIAEVHDPRERAIAYIVHTLREVRSKPGTAAWFDPAASGMAARMSRSSEVIETLTRTFSGEWEATPERDEAARLRGRWLVRIIVSLLADPEGDPASERALIERFVAPSLLA